MSGCIENPADMCRACMRLDGVLLPMYGNELSQKHLPDKLAELASIQIKRYDGLPTMLCVKCAYRTDAFYDFKLQVQASEKMLREMFEKQIALQIKEEGVPMDMSERIEWLHDRDSIAASDSVENVVRRDIKDLVKKVEKVEEEELDPGVTTAGTTWQVHEEPETLDSSEEIRTAADESEFDKAEGPDVVSDKVIISPEEQSNEVSDLRSPEPIKDAESDAIGDILKSQDLDYAIMYVEPDSSIKEVLDEHAEVYIINNTISGKSTDDNVTYVQDNMMEPAAETEDENTSTSVFPPVDQSNDQSITVQCKYWTAGFSMGRAVDGEDSESVSDDGPTYLLLEKYQVVMASEDGDTDYFVDPRDNILGSLNDTIIKIKEVKLDKDVVNYQCTLCMQNYEDLSGALTHTVDNHVPATGPFFCMVCEKDCESHRQLRAHVKTHTGQYPYTCFICNKAYSLKRYLKRHMVCHTDFPRHRCPKCGLRFKTKTELDSHSSTAHTVLGSPYACSQCPRVFNHKGNYKRHLITHLDPKGLHLPKYPCKICGKRFLNNRTLATHTRVHTGEKPFNCDVCNKSFSQQGNLLNHLRIHSNPRSYTCEVCGKRFNQRATLKDHSLLHTGEKPYICNVCGVAFTFSAALRRHMWSHAGGGKPYGCETCSARFVGKYDLKRHMRVHSDRPRGKRKRNQQKKENDSFSLEESPAGHIIAVTQEQPHVDTETMLIEQVLSNQGATQVMPAVGRQKESEKENVDALFNLVQFGE